MKLLDLIPITKVPKDTVLSSDIYSDSEGIILVLLDGNVRGYIAYHYDNEDWRYYININNVPELVEDSLSSLLTKIIESSEEHITFKFLPFKN